MRVLIILPNWLGDAVMASAAIEQLVKHEKSARITFIGSIASVELFRMHPHCERVLIDRTKDAKSRFFGTKELAAIVGRVDLAISFRNQFFSALLLFFVKAAQKVMRTKWHSSLLLKKSVIVPEKVHQVVRYLSLVGTLYDVDYEQKLVLSIPKKPKTKTLGINPGATYGSAKRWYPERFAEVAFAFHQQYDIVIFGGPNEVSMANEIESLLKKEGVKNIVNLAGKTTIVELCEEISSLSCFLTNDSGPMHIAAAYQIPTVAVFGPTRHEETCQWENEKSLIIRHEIECAPCMKRECPLKHHECMKKISANEVIKAMELVSRT